MKITLQHIGDLPQTVQTANSGRTKIIIKKIKNYRKYRGPDVPRKNQEREKSYNCVIKVALRSIE